MTRHRSAGARLGYHLGRAARRVGLGRPVVAAAAAVLRRLDPGNPALPPAPPGATQPVRTPDRAARMARNAAHLATVPSGYAQGRADLQFVHDPYAWHTRHECAGRCAAHTEGGLLP